MAKSWQHSLLIMSLYFLNVFHQVTLSTNTISSKQQVRCHDNESFALIQLKQSFSINKFASTSPYAYSKVASWKQNGSGSGTTDDCCSWDGVACSEDTGYVIGLDLSSSFIYGPINISSSLFLLVHLQSLDLSDNNFVGSQIPFGIASLSQLTSLNLSFSVFSGQIPKEISQLTKLASLDLSLNTLQLQSLSFEHLVQNLTGLKELSLSFVNISSQVPHSLANLTSLRYLALKKCGLTGEFPSRIFHLPDLQYLRVSLNEKLTGFLPEFHTVSRLEYLRLQRTSFFGPLPVSIGNLKSLVFLDLFNCSFSGSLPASLDNLTELTTLDLSYNGFKGYIPSLASLSELREILLSNNEFNGGKLPNWLGKLAKLTYVDLFNTNLYGIVEADVFLNLKSLQFLELSNNKITFMDTKNYTNATIPQFQGLGLTLCNLKEFPYFLTYQNELQFLSLAGNYIQGQIPKWLLNCSKETLEFVDLNGNFLTGFEKYPFTLPWVGVRFVDIGHNMLQGSLPVPPPSTMIYLAQQNRLTGEIPPLICQVSSLRILDLSHNNMTGVIPQCLGNQINSLSVLMLKGNNFRGTMPNSYVKGSKLELIDISENKLAGQLARSLANCSMLQFVNIADNSVDDNFPSWLGILSDLRILILRSNKFHGEIQSSLAINSGQFPKLRILDLSNNRFEGRLPYDYMNRSWPAMKMEISDSKAAYLHDLTTLKLHYSYSHTYDFSMSITNRGVKREYQKIWNVFTALDVSSNRLVGEISATIGQLQGLQSLNLSNNYLTGCIPRTFINLTNLESLDLSRNRLSGEIPPQLAQLTFLAFLNVSHNHLVGPIPQGKQLSTFQNNSYEGNIGLCGEPLSKKCGKLHVPWIAPKAEEDDDSLFPNAAVDWIIIFLGLASGLVVGLIFGQYLTNRHLAWFVRKLGTEGF